MHCQQIIAGMASGINYDRSNYITVGDHMTNTCNHTKVGPYWPEP